MGVPGWIRCLVEGFLRIVARFYCLFVFDNATEIAKALALTFIVFPERATRKQKRIKGQPNRHEHEVRGDCLNRNGNENGNNKMRKT